MRRKKPHADTTVPHIPAGGHHDALTADISPPSGDELTERLKQQTAARIKESRQLLDAAKQKLKKTRKGPSRVFLGATDQR
jgi:hypothetical protein